MPYQNRALKPDATFSQDLSAAALSFTSSFARRVKVHSVHIKASVAITETVTITLDSVNGVNYDSVLASYDLVAETDFVYKPPDGLILQIGDEIKIQCTAANITGVVRGMIKSSELTA